MFPTICGIHCQCRTGLEARARVTKRETGDEPPQQDITTEHLGISQTARKQEIRERERDRVIAC